MIKSQDPKEIHVLLLDTQWGIVNTLLIVKYAIYADLTTYCKEMDIWSQYHILYSRKCHVFSLIIGVFCLFFYGVERTNLQIAERKRGTLTHSVTLLSPHMHERVCTTQQSIKGESGILSGLSQCRKQVHGERVLLCAASENCGELAKHMAT